MRLSSVQIKTKSQKFFPKMKSRLIFLSFLFVLIIFSVLMLLPLNPSEHYIGNDSGVFLYTASIMKSGGTPYIDSWDHKGPFVYFINLLGISLFPNEQWGLFVLQQLMMLFSLFMLTASLSKKLCKTAIFAGFTLFLLLFPRTFGAGNQVEFYSALFLMISFSLLIRNTTKERVWRWGLIGIFGGIVLLIQMNNAAFWAVCGLWLFLRCFRDRKHISSLFFYILGLCIPVMSAFIFLFTRKALYDFFDQYIRYNILYSDVNSGIAWKIKSIFINCFSTFGTILFSICALLFLFLIITTISQRDTIRLFSFEKYDVFLFFLVSFLSDFVLTGLSGRQYPHYLGILPVYFFIFAAYYLKKILISPKISKKINCAATKGIAFFVCLLCCTYAVTDDVKVLLSNRSILFTDAYFNTFPTTEIETFINENTSPDDTVLLWGGDTRYNYSTGRRSPTRYTYPFVLMNCTYASYAKWKEFTDQIITNPPAMILEMKTLTFPVYWEVPENCFNQKEEMNRFFSFVETNYKSLPSETEGVDDTFYLIEHSAF